MSRRAVLAGGAGALAISAWEIGGEGSALAASGRCRALLKEPALHRKHYAQAVGKVFRARSGGKVHRLKLVSIADHDATPRLRNVNFTLVFKPLGGHHLPDAIYTLHRPGVPTRALLLSSLGTAGRLQAVINRAH